MWYNHTPFNYRNWHGTEYHSQFLLDAAHSFWLMICILYWSNDHKSGSSCWQDIAYGAIKLSRMMVATIGITSNGCSKPGEYSLQVYTDYTQILLYFVDRIFQWEMMNDAHSILRAYVYTSVGLHCNICVKNVNTQIILAIWKHKMEQIIIYIYLLNISYYYIYLKILLICYSKPLRRLCFTGQVAISHDW